MGSNGVREIENKDDKNSQPGSQLQLERSKSRVGG